MILINSKGITIKLEADLLYYIYIISTDKLSFQCNAVYMLLVYKMPV